ncbi:MAG: Bug family tripartite tricarboxylate transporter substrate binding protein [bacterium]|jgi:tripartite-type tricarboxylate transporter receptor subunit TctC|nr:tripartite tricarboxylate transporter substrate binding protein [Rhodocyclaceae bacterium]MCA4901938.1 tripartite tricarboxylate transporter substrate binding protein [Rhodocyclaceae bacterium]MCE2980949.1 tripartite tricarboxylate transporter substrate binding protein [Betaproteobacteria bacterium]
MRNAFRAVAVAVAVVAVAPSTATAQPAWPAKPIRMLVGYAPGGPVDIVGRLTSQRLSELLGQAVLVENRPGAGATIAVEAVARAVPDGYTLLTAGGGELSIAPSIYPALGYNPLKDLAPVGLIASSPLMLVVNPRVPVQDVKALVALVRGQPGRINFASSGSGSTAQLASELFAVMTGTQIVHIPYKGAGPALADLVGGQVDMMFTGVSAALPFVRSGKLRALGVSGTRRLAALPEYAPVADAVPGFEVTTIYAMMGPTALPKDIVQRLNTELGRLVAEPGPRERLLALGAEPAGGTPEQLAAYIAREIPKWAKIVKAAKIKGE